MQLPVDPHSSPLEQAPPSARLQVLVRPGETHIQAILGAVLVAKLLQLISRYISSTTSISRRKFSKLRKFYTG